MTSVQTSAALVNHPRIDGVAFIGGPYYLQRFAVEKTLTVNTTAKGGSVELWREVGAPRTKF